jgi:hypothetical protein
LITQQLLSEVAGSLSSHTMDVEQLMARLFAEIRTKREIKWTPTKQK